MIKKEREKTSKVRPALDTPFELLAPGVLVATIPTALGLKFGDMNLAFCCAFPCMGLEGSEFGVIGLPTFGVAAFAR